MAETREMMLSSPGGLIGGVFINESAPPDTIEVMAPNGVFLNTTTEEAAGGGVAITGAFKPVFRPRRRMRGI